MNAETRKKLEVVTKTLRTLYDEVDDIGQDERAKFDNLSEGLQAAESGQNMESAADALESAASSIDSAIDDIDNIS